MPNFFHIFQAVRIRELVNNARVRHRNRTVTWQDICIKWGTIVIEWLHNFSKNLRNEEFFDNEVHLIPLQSWWAIVGVPGKQDRGSLPRIQHSRSVGLRQEYHQEAESQANSWQNMGCFNSSKRVKTWFWIQKGRKIFSGATRFFHSYISWIRWPISRMVWKYFLGSWRASTTRLCWQKLLPTPQDISRELEPCSSDG